MTEMTIRGKASESHPSPEQLALLVTGRLADEERREVIDHLTRCEDCFEVVGDVLAFAESEEAQGESPEPAVPAAEPGERGEVAIHPAAARGGGKERRWGWASLAAAAGIAAALLAGVLYLRQPAVEPVIGERTVASLAPADWAEPRWEPWRSGAGRALPEEVAAFRIGVRAVDLEAALGAGEREAAARIARELDELLGSVPLGQIEAAAYERIAASLETGADPPAVLGAAVETRAQLGAEGSPVPSAPFQLGVWSEAGRLAAVAGDVEYFRRREVRRKAEELAGAPGVGGEDAGRIGEILAILEGGVGAEDLEELGRKLSSLSAGG